MRRTFYLGPHIWFHLFYTDGKLVALEEHDIREGGGKLPEPNQSLEDLFVQSAQSRTTNDPEKDISKRARAFLQSNEEIGYGIKMPI